MSASPSTTGTAVTGHSGGGCGPNWRGQGDAATRAAALAAQLAERYPQDRDQPFARVPVLQIVGVIGWAAAAG